MISRPIANTNLEVIDEPYAPVIRCWALGLLVDVVGFRRLSSNSSTAKSLDAESLELLGISVEAVLDDDEDAADIGLVWPLLAEARRDQPRINLSSVDGPLLVNLRALRDKLGLSETEVTLLAFAALISNQGVLRLASEALGSISSEQVIVVLARALDLDYKDVKHALNPRSLLGRAHLLTLDREYETLFDQITPMPGLVDALLGVHEDVYSLISAFVARSISPKLVATDFAHIHEQLEVARQYLSHALDHRVEGVNILLYGPPGTGKTELARVLAADVSAHAFDVCLEDADGEAVNERERLTAYQLGQFVLSRHERAIILFDEVEDLFNHFAPFDRRGAWKLGKAWTNRVLEHNPVPAIWILNDVESMDAAYVRRFDLVLHIDIPPQRVRKTILQQSLGELRVSEDWLSQQSEDATLAPAIVTRAARVTHAVETADTEHTMSWLIAETSKAMGVARRRERGPRSPLEYRLEWLNCDADLPTLVRNLKRLPNARFCFYGPPGTGKSAFATHLAKELEMPCHIKSASSILNPFVGETEQRIARAFSDARRENAVLFLDEADSFLKQRTQTSQSWEITQVNELLMQMEAFDGILICATNLMNSLDAASLRRFDCKIRFGYLNANQLISLIHSLVEDDDYLDTELCRHRVTSLQEVALGDVAAALRQLNLIDTRRSADAIVRLLEQEVQIRSEFS